MTRDLKKEENFLFCFPDYGQKDKIKKGNRQG
jgi:hypothetical protein